MRCESVSGTEQSSRRKVLHECAQPERPRLRVFRRVYAIDQRAEFRGGDAYFVPDLVREAAAVLIAILGRGEQRAKEQRKAVRIMMFAQRLPDELSRVAADLAHTALALQPEPILPLDLQLHDRRTNILQAEVIVEEPDERANGA